jgi:hypothetical protein
MSDQSPAFRDFGILPTDLPPPPATVRSYLSKGRVVGQYIGTGIVAAFGVGLALVFALTLPPSLALLGAAASLMGCGAVIHLATHNDYRWVELDGDTLRARHLYTGRTIERSIADIDCLGTMVYQVGGATTLVMERLLGRVKGVEIRFRDRRTPLRILRADPAMANAAELIEAVLYRMRQQRELDTEIINWIGQPLVRRIWWKGETPARPPGKALKLWLALLMFFALMFGAVCGFVWIKVHELHEVGSRPPHEMTLRSLIENGPGENRHVTVTDFQPGGYAMETQGKSWTTVWVALFPAGARAEDRKAIPVVAYSSHIHSEPELRLWLRGGRITGICTSERRTNFGTALGPLIEQVNPGSTLSAAWSIEELHEPPSAATVTATLMGSVGCFAAVLILAMILFWL